MTPYRSPYVTGLRSESLTDALALEEMMNGSYMLALTSVCCACNVHACVFAAFSTHALGIMRVRLCACLHLCLGAHESADNCAC